MQAVEKASHRIELRIASAPIQTRGYLPTVQSGVEGIF